MHVSDVALECAQECARLSRQCPDRQMGLALFEISARLFSAATQDAELIADDTRATSGPALHASLPSNSVTTACRK
jgi:hypothetical protein